MLLARYSKDIHLKIKSSNNFINVLKAKLKKIYMYLKLF